ncbi:hypothetical protein HHK36_003861 [Tetracentron sinense]|uniref:Protein DETOXIFICATION n=1 Tax=Tetracentron sinense TaxID=13715 RepID=A0A834ZP14_TETSI|nr:hypothetical protein HHK36_003861 [Tetracentron sinense]
MGESHGVTEPLLLRLDSNARVADLSSDVVEEFLSQSPVQSVSWPRLVVWESRLLWILSGASIAVSIFNFMLSLITQMFTGHLGALELAGASIASVGIQGLAYGIMLGMASAVQTVCGQAYGAKKYAAMGIICQRAMVLHLGAAVLLSFIYWYSGPILIAIGQSHSIAEQGQIFARGIILQLFAFALNCPMQRFLQAQNIVNPLAYIAVAVLLIHVLLTWVVVSVLNYGLLGAALTLSFSCLEIWYNQGLVLISGLLSNPTISLDSISICMNYLNWDMQFMLGLSTAASIRVGNELGAAHPKVAKLAVIVVSATSISISIVFTAVVLICSTALSKLFTSNAAVLEAVSNLIPLLAISVFLNGIQPILSGVAIGSGWQALVAYVNLTTYYIIGLPIGCVLGFKTSLGVAGIWWGMILGVSLQTIVLIILTARTNWNHEVDKAAERIRKSSEEAALDLVDGIA